MAHFWPAARSRAARRRTASSCSLMKSQASSVSSVSGTTSRAEKQAASPMLSVPWPVKYQWWPVPTMPPRQVEDGVQVDERVAVVRLTRPELEEHDGHEHRGEELEEAFDPEVDDPEPPVVDHGEVGARTEEERRQVEERDRHGGIEEQRGELSAFGRLASPGASARNIRKSQNTRPAASSSCQKRPRSRYSEPWCPSQNQSFPSWSLMPEELAEQAAEDHDGQRAEEQRATPSLLPLRLARRRRAAPGRARPPPRRWRSRRWRAAGARCGARL